MVDIEDVLASTAKFSCRVSRPEDCVKYSNDAAKRQWLDLHTSALTVSTFSKCFQHLP
jgi:hypothetical protein